MDHRGSPCSERMPETINNMTYFSIYTVRAKKDRGTHLCNVFAKDKTHAMKIARTNGFTLPRGSYAVEIGRDGYFRRLAQARNEIENLKDQINCALDIIASLKKQ